MSTEVRPKADVAKKLRGQRRDQDAESVEDSPPAAVPDAATRRPTPKLVALLALGPGLLALAGIWDFRGFVQDDAYISLRYSGNLVAGHGLVFNPGEYTEGFSNPAWTLLGSLALAVGLPAITVWQALGILAGFCLVPTTLLIGWEVGGPLVGVAAALAVSGSSTLHAWSGSGLEAGAFALVLNLAILAHLRRRDSLAFGLLGLAQWIRPEALLPAAALVLVRLAEVFLGSGGSAGDPRGSGAPARDPRSALREIARQASAFAGPMLALLAFRWLYYGSLVPNTYLVKGGGNPASHLLGLKEMAELVEFQGTGALWILALVALLPGGASPGGERVPWVRAGAWATGAVLAAGCHLWLSDGGFWKSAAATGWSLGAALESGRIPLGWTLLSALLGGAAAHTLTLPPWLRERRGHLLLALIWLGWVYYFVRVGGDLLPMHRLFLPAVPWQAVLAALGAARLAAWLGELGSLLPGDPRERRAEARGAAAGLATLAFAGYAWMGLAYTGSQGHYRTVQDALDGCHGQAGRDLEQLARSFERRPVVLAQDMGALPWNAPGCDFVDSIGLTDRPIATILRKYLYSPYFRYLVWESEVERKKIEAMEKELREHITRISPDYVVINAHLEARDTEEARRAAEARNGRFFRRFLVDNTFFYRWPGEPVFDEKYRLIRAYEYSPIHFLCTYRRVDRPDFPDAEPSED